MGMEYIRCRVCELKVAIEFQGARISDDDDDILWEFGYLKREFAQCSSHLIKFLLRESHLLLIDRHSPHFLTQPHSHLPHHLKPFQFYCILSYFNLPYFDLQIQIQTNTPIDNIKFLTKMFVRKGINSFFKPAASSIFKQSFTKYQYAQQFVKPGKQKLVGSWLFMTAAGVLSMIIIGGYTRLTHSGLSMADWSPYTKSYPSNEEQWNREFDKYKQTIQYKTVNKNIDLQGFKPIYNVEFFHRKVGMYLGYFFIAPLGFFTYKKFITPKLRNRLFGLLGLGGLQGLIGWWMVKSGLKQKPDYQDRPRVSPYRLMTHLMMATMIYSGVLYNAFTLLIKPVAVEAGDVKQLKYLRKIRIIGLIMIKCILLNIFSGALVAGIDAGKVYNTWPDMNGKLIPATAFDNTPKWKNFFQNRALVQFDHRIMAYITQSVSLYLIYTIFKYKIPGPATMAGMLAFTMINYQALSGILTLLALVPKEKANMHQATALLTLSSALLMVYLTKVPLAAAVV